MILAQGVMRSLVSRAAGPLTLVAPGGSPDRIGTATWLPYGSHSTNREVYLEFYSDLITHLLTRSWVLAHFTSPNIPSFHQFASKEHHQCKTFKVLGDVAWIVKLPGFWGIKQCKFMKFGGIFPIHGA